MQKISSFRRRYLFIAMFAMLLVFAGFSMISQQVSAASTIPVGGTVPPGGTIPPGGTVPPLPAALQGQINIVDEAFSTTGVDVCTKTNIPVTGATNLHYQDQSGFLTLPAGVYDWKVTAANSNCGTTLVNIPPFTLSAQGVLTLFITGDGSTNQPFNTVLIVQNLGLFLKLYLPLITQNL